MLASLACRDLDSRFSVIGQGSFHINDTTTTDAGIYTCRFTNQEGSVDVDATLSILGMCYMLFAFRWRMLKRLNISQRDLNQQGEIASIS